MTAAEQFEGVPDDELATFKPTHAPEPARWTDSKQPVQWQRLIGIDQQAVPDAADLDPRLKEPGVMRALHESVCRGCESTIGRGEVQALIDLPEVGRFWGHAECREPEAGS